MPGSNIRAQNAKGLLNEVLRREVVSTPIRREISISFKDYLAWLDTIIDYILNDQ